MIPQQPVAPSSSLQKSGSSSETPEAGWLLMQLSLSRAAELARAGAYQEAETLLRTTDPNDLPIAGLDLLARICAQQGRFEEAQQWWQAVLAREPENRAARSGLEQLAKEQTAAGNHQAFLHRWWAGMKNRFFPKRRYPPGVQKDLNIQVPGLTAHWKGNHIAFVFHFPPFGDSGDSLTEEGKKALALFGWQLEPYVGKITIEIIGQPDRLPDTQDGLPRDVAALGMARAFAVFNHLVQTTKLQARMFSLRTGDDFLCSPAATNHPEPPSVCRSVVLLVSFL